jgi:outer membrane protein assembly factor BamB
MILRSWLIPAICLAALTVPAGGADWPQWRGPDRTDVSQETGLLKSWPKQGPALLWTFPDAGVGYSGPAIVGDRLFTMGARGETEYVLALDAQTGKEVWSAEVGPKFSEKRGDGPRCTVSVAGDFLYALGAEGDLVCVETATGKKHWHVSLTHDLGGKLMSGWGYSESPLVDGTQVVCTPGGSKGTLAALDKKSGKVLWRSKKLTDPAGYASMIVADVDGVRQYIQATGKGVAGVAANDGRLLWRYEKPEFRVAVIPTPIYHDHHVYITSGYGAGCELIKLTHEGKAFKAEKVYANKNMVNHHGGVVLVGDDLFGYSDSERAWVCQDLQSGKIVWEEKQKLKKGSLTCADGQLYCYSEDKGTVALVQATPEGWKEHGRFTVPRESSLRKPDGRFWTHPVVANGRMYLRDQDLIFCFDVRDRASSRR